MAYEVTATRKRPQQFENLAGQQFVVSTIRNAIEQGRIAHAYLFSGPRGVGKTSSARILAKALNCEHGPTAHPCGTCANCTEITKGNSVDVIEIDGASNTSVNDIRQIKDEVLFPQASRYKIYIIDEVHMLSTSAFNALLKTIEEPPSYIVFIFATTEPQKVPATIRSRCQQFHFRLIELDTIRECLKQAASEMQVEADDDALFWIAKESTGSMRDAYTLFDQVVAFSDGHITMEKISGKLGLVGIDRENAIVSAVLEGRENDALLSVGALLKDGVSVEQCIKDFCEYFRSLLLIKAGVTEESVLGMQSERIEPSVRTAYTKEQLEAAFQMFLDLYRDIRYSLNPRFELELAVSRLGTLKDLVSPTTLVKRLNQVKDDLLAGKLSPMPTARAATAAPVRTVERPAAPPERPAAQQEETAAGPAAPRENRPFSRDDLPALVSRLSKTPLLSQIAQSIDKVENANGTLNLEFTTKFCKDKAEENRARFGALIEEISGYRGPMTFSFVPEDRKENRPEDDPVVKTIASVFRGEIQQ